MDATSSGTSSSQQPKGRKNLRGPSVFVSKEEAPKPSLVPAFTLLAIFSSAYVQLQRQGTLSVPSNPDFFQHHPIVTGTLTFIGIANMFNHIAGYLQPVPMWSLFTGAFIDFNSSAGYALVYYWIGYTPLWLIVCWIFQMSIHSYYMSTGLSKPEASAAAFASLMAHMRKLQTNTKDWWNTLFLYFDMTFHCVFLLEVLPVTSRLLLAVDVVLSALLYSFLYNRAVDTDGSTKRPILYIDMKSKELRCPCPICNRAKPFSVGCSQWFASIDQLYLDCWGIHEDGQKQTKSLMERVQMEEELLDKEQEENPRARRRSTLHVMY
jgi:hypothetical protein